MRKHDIRNLQRVEADVKKQKLIAHLKEHGCERIRDARHGELWAKNGSRTNIPTHTEILDATARNICNQLGIPQPQSRS